MRGVGVGDGLGDGVGVGVCASALRGSLVAVKLAAPSAGRSFTNERRLFEVLFFDLLARFAESSFLRFTCFSCNDQTQR